MIGRCFGSCEHLSVEEEISAVCGAHACSWSIFFSLVVNEYIGSLENLAKCF